MVTRLKDGTRVLVRPIRPDDKPLLVAGLSRLSEATIYRRFLSPKPGFSKAELRYLTEVDGRDHFALVVVLADRPDVLVAVARYVRTADRPDVAEAAVVVADPLQRNGLGKLLALRLADEAQHHGIRRFEATMLGDNAGAQRLLETVAARFGAGATHSGTREVVAELAA